MCYRQPDVETLSGHYRVVFNNKGYKGLVEIARNGHVRPLAKPYPSQLYDRTTLDSSTGIFRLRNLMKNGTVLVSLQFHWSGGVVSRLRVGQWTERAGGGTEWVTESYPGRRDTDDLRRFLEDPDGNQNTEGISSSLLSLVHFIECVPDCLVCVLHLSSEPLRTQIKPPTPPGSRRRIVGTPVPI